MQERDFVFTFVLLTQTLRQHPQDLHKPQTTASSTMTIRDVDPTARDAPVDPEDPQPATPSVPARGVTFAKAMEDDLQPVQLTDRAEEAPAITYSKPTPFVPLAASLPVDLSHREFPDVFYCPITKELFDDPVVSPDGDSYERHAITERGDIPDEKLYSNRALKQLIDEQIELSGDSIRAGLKRFDRTVRTTFNHLLEKSALPSGTEHHPLPEAYYCSITFNLMHDPVIDPDGHTYERVAIENWIQVNGKSPATRTPLTVGDLYENRSIFTLLEQEKNRPEETIHPAIRKFKAEKPPQRTDAEMGGNVVAAAEGNRSQQQQQQHQTSTLPTTQAEIDARQQQQNRANCTQFGVLIAIIVLILFVPYGLYVAWAICCCVCFLNRQRRE
jgi:hypothetical protein